MGFFSRIFGSKKGAGSKSGSASKQAQTATVKHFKDFVASHEGCEVFIEPATRVTQTTMVVVADTGEWTRRRVPDPAAAKKLSKDLGVPAFDVNLSGYPSRMREWNQRNRKG
jgi:hypothetical protein